MKRKGLFFLILLIGHIGFAQIPNGYYDNAIGLTGSSLKSALRNIIDGHDSQSYSSLWDHFEDTDKKANGKVWDMYSDVPGGTPPYEYNFGSDQCGTYSQEGDCYNREHSFPGSWFNDASPMYTDLFHLIPSDGYVNGQRGNYPYGEVGSASWTSLNGCKKGSCNYPGYSGTVFEPIDEYKGDIARAYFYMATRYMSQFSSFNSPMISGSDYTSWAVNLLIDWHQADPVSDKEINRNNAIYLIQDNRNPYIDHPEFVECVWLNQCNYGPTIANVDYLPELPSATDDVVVTASITDEGSVVGAELFWCTDGTSFNNSLVMNNTSGDIYTATIPAHSEGTEISFKIEAEDNEANISESAVYSYTVGANVYALINEDFTICPPNGWTVYDVACSDRNWECNAGVIEINAYNGEAPADDWLISTPVNLNHYINEVLTFDTWTKYSDAIYPPLKLKYSTDYSGSGSPSSASWTELSYTASPEASETWTSSGNIDLSAIEGEEVYFAWQYISTGNGAGTSAHWKLDNIYIEVEPSGINKSSLDEVNLSIYPNPTNGLFTVKVGSVASQVNIRLSVYNSIMNEVYSKNAYIDQGNTKLNIDLNNASPGIYFVKIQTGENVIIRKLNVL